jgi:hypothetical protein
MEPEGSLPCSQEPSTGPYPEPDQSNPYHPISLISILILSTYLRLGLPSGPFPSGFPINILYTFIFSPFVLHALPISSFLTWSFWLYLEKSTSYEAHHLTFTSSKSCILLMFSNKKLYAFHISPKGVSCHVHLILLHCITLVILDEYYEMRWCWLCNIIRIYKVQ